MDVGTFFKRLKARIPQDLPRGMDELNAFIDSLLTTYDLPSTRGYQRMIATMIQHLPQSQGRASKHQFYLSIKRAEATETAFWKLQALKEEEVKEKADQARAQQAATPNEVESPPEPQVQDAGVPQTPAGMVPEA